ncbi:PD-(D/E)XK nuclease family protein, partial [Blastomonas sp.]|uniref:PD-(D/E)XK nuclease family protein n=1 Tax=Blastomonas sp. TaxID=1909299 RepID=UPI0035931DEB
GPALVEAARRGLILHSLFERLPGVPDQDREAAAGRWLKSQHGLGDPAQQKDIVSSVLAVLNNPDWAEFFGPEALAEAPIAAVVGSHVVAGTVDRLLITPQRVLIIDFKTTRRPPETLERLPRAHVRQMAAYVAALRVIFPGRQVEAALLYTHLPKLYLLPDALIDTVKLD